MTLDAGKGYAPDFVNELQAMNVRPQMAQNNECRGASVIDPPATRHFANKM